MKTIGQFSLSLLAVTMSQAFAADLSALPPAHTEGSVTYLTGGVGKPESDAMKAVAGRYDLAFTFANRNREFLANVKVDISNRRGDRLLDIVSGPILLVDLPNGSYTVRADVGGSPMVKRFDVTGRKSHEVAYIWPTGVDQRAEFAAFEIKPMLPTPIAMPPQRSDITRYGGGLDHVSDGIWSEGFQNY